jgi:hypothetical protein
MTWFERKMPAVISALRIIQSGRNILPPMTFDKTLPLLGLGVLFFVQSGFALGQTRYVDTIPGRGSFPIVRQRVAANLFVDCRNSW